MAGEGDTFILVILAIIFPPVAVAFLSGCGADWCLNLLLTLLGYLPGMIHAFWLIIMRSEANNSYGYKNWTYHGMGEYRPRTPGAPPLGRGEPPPPPAGAPPPGQYTAPPPAPGQAPVDQRGGDGYAPPQPAPADSRQGYQGGQAQPSQEPQAPADQKQTESTAQSTAPPTYRGA